MARQEQQIYNPPETSEKGHPRATGQPGGHGTTKLTDPAKELIHRFGCQIGSSKPHLSLSRQGRISVPGANEAKEGRCHQREQKQVSNPPPAPKSQGQSPHPHELSGKGEF